MTYLQKKKNAFLTFINRARGFLKAVTGTSSLTLSDCVDDESLVSLSIKGAVGGIGEVNYFNIGATNSWIKLGAANSIEIDGNVAIGTSLLKTAYQYIARRFATADSPLLGKTITISFDCKLTNWTRSTSMLVGYFSNGTSGQFQTLTGGNKQNITNGTYVYTVTLPSEIPSGANGFYLFWYTGFSSSDITIGQTIELSDIMVLERSYTASTIHGYIPYGKYGLTFTITGQAETKKAVITLDEPLGYNITADVLTLNYSSQTATKNIGDEPQQTVDVTSQIDWSSVPQTQTGTTVITATSATLPSAMEATYYSSTD